MRYYRLCWSIPDVVVAARGDAWISGIICLLSSRLQAEGTEPEKERLEASSLSTNPHGRTMANKNYSCFSWAQAYTNYQLKPRMQLDTVAVITIGLCSFGRRKILHHHRKGKTRHRMALWNTRQSYQNLIIIFLSFFLLESRPTHACSFHLTAQSCIMTATDGPYWERTPFRTDR